MSKKVRVAIFGLGFVGGRAHAPALRKIPGAELVAVVDIIEEKAKAIAEKYGTDYHLDYKEVLKNPSIDAVIVAVPTPFHYKAVLEAITSHKHALCEMPLTPTIEESRKLGEEAEKDGVILMPDLNFRFTPNYVRAKELIGQGAIGKPLAVTFSEHIPAKELAAQWPYGSWAWDIQKSGGYPDFTLSVWSVDLVKWLLTSEIVHVQWVSNYGPLKGIDNFLGYNTMGIVQFSEGTVGLLHYSSTVSSGEETSRLEIFGDNTAVLRANWNNYLALTKDGSKQEFTFEEKGTRVWGHYQIDAHFIECILQGKKPAVTADDAIKVQSVAAKMVKKEVIGRGSAS